MEYLNGAARVVVKIGSSLLVDDKTGSIRSDWLQSLSEDIRDMHSKGLEVVIVSSGSAGRRNHFHWNNHKLLRRLVKLSLRKPIRRHLRNIVLGLLRYLSHLKIVKIGGVI